MRGLSKVYHLKLLQHRYLSENEKKNTKAFFENAIIVNQIATGGIIGMNFRFYLIRFHFDS